MFTIVDKGLCHSEQSEESQFTRLRCSPALAAQVQVSLRSHRPGILREHDITN